MDKEALVEQGTLTRLFLIRDALLLAATFIEGHAIDAVDHGTAYKRGCKDCEGVSSYADHIAYWLKGEAMKLRAKTR